MEDAEPDRNRGWTILNLIQWVVSIFLLLAALGSLATGGVAASLVFLLVSALTLPPMSRRIKLPISFGTKLGIIVVGLILGAALSPSDKDVTISKPSTQASVAAATSKSSSTLEVQRNVPFKLGGFTYVINGIYQTTSIKTRSFGEKIASPGGLYLIVDFTITNDGRETKTVMASDFRIRDVQGREFRPSSEASALVAMASGRDLILSELQPGLARQTYTSFEIPKVVYESGFYLVIPEKGWAGSKKAVLAVGFDKKTPK